MCSWGSPPSHHPVLGAHCRLSIGASTSNPRVTGLSPLLDCPFQPVPGPLPAQLVSMGVSHSPLTSLPIRSCPPCLRWTVIQTDLPYGEKLGKKSNLGSTGNCKNIGESWVDERSLLLSKPAHPEGTPGVGGDESRGLTSTSKVPTLLLIFLPL